VTNRKAAAEYLVQSRAAGLTPGSVYRLRNFFRCHWRSGREAEFTEHSIFYFGTGFVYTVVAVSKKPIFRMRSL
jgi:hypothetical protein